MRASASNSIKYFGSSSTLQNLVNPMTARDTTNSADLSLAWNNLAAAQPRKTDPSEMNETIMEQFSDATSIRAMEMSQNGGVSAPISPFNSKLSLQPTQLDALNGEIRKLKETAELNAEK